MTTIFLSNLIAPLISPTHATIYHMSGPATPLFAATLTYFFGLWGALTALIVLAERDSRLAVAIWGALLFWLPWVAAEFYAVQTLRPLGHHLGVVLFAGAAMAWLAAVLFWRPALAPRLRRARRAASLALGLVALSGVACLAQLFAYGWAARDLNAWSPRPPSAAQSMPAPQGRIVWIVLDELSYQQVYERRYPGLQLPALDALASQATVFTNTQPAGFSTELVLPALMTGIPTTKINVSPSGRLTGLYDAQSRQRQSFDPRNTVFADALSHGYSDAVVGWYNPYCRILRGLLDRCAWRWDSPDLYRSNDFSIFMADVKFFWLNLLDKIFPFRSANHPENALQHVLKKQQEAYKDLERDALKDLRDPQLNFVLLHVPVPHPIGFFDRQTGQFAATNTSYVDNLALADRFLGEARATLESAGAWNSATIVVMGDHSWRVNQLWRGGPYWTAEDEAASQGGKFDPRPAYIVKLPGQQTSARIDRPFAALRTRALLDAVMERRIQTPAQLEAWAQAGQ